MNELDHEKVQKHINILNVAYHLNLEITDDSHAEVKAICPFCGYNKNSKIATLSLNTINNKYHCIRCGAGGYSTGLYAKVRNIDTKKAYRELMDRECYSINRTNIVISPINDIADIDKRDAVYRDFLNMLKLDSKHRKYLENLGLLKSSIENQIYKSVPHEYIKRRLIGNSLKKKYDLSGIPRILSRGRLGLDFYECKGFFCTSF